MSKTPDFSALEQALDATVTRQARLPVGYGLKGYHLALSDGRELAVKAGDAPLPDQLEAEAHMLRSLKASSNLPVPDVLYADPRMLAMTWINSTQGQITPAHQRHMARLLSDLHRPPRPFFGFERDTVIGILPQPNPPTPAWVPFFRDQRLLFLARFAHERGKLPASLLTRLQHLGEKLESWLDEPSHPALIHGDIWSGNVLLGNSQINALIDPAVYYAHPEIELAYLTMFGSFGDDFFREYGALTPFDRDGFFARRRGIYLLYPLLVHVLLCGPAYLRDIENTLQNLKV